MNQSQAPGPVAKAAILTQAQQYISKLVPLIDKTEEFALACIQESWAPGIQLALKLSGDWISISEKVKSGQVIKYAQGAPAFVAWRMLSLCGAKALDEESFDLLRLILQEPIEVEEPAGGFSNRSFVERRDLFYPEAFLGYADSPMKYMDGIWSDHRNLQAFFVSNEGYQLAIARFFIVVCLASTQKQAGDPLYPGYRLLAQAERAMSQLCSRLSAAPTYLEGIARAMGESEAHLVETWSERMQRINGVDIGGWHRILHRKTEVPHRLDYRID